MSLAKACLRRWWGNRTDDPCDVFESWATSLCKRESDVPALAESRAVVYR